MSKIDEIEKELTEIYQGPIALFHDNERGEYEMLKAGRPGVVLNAEADAQFYRQARDRIAALVAYVRAAEHIIQLGRSAVTDGDFISDAESSMQAAREKLGLK